MIERFCYHYQLAVVLLHSQNILPQMKSMDKMLKEKRTILDSSYKWYHLVFGGDRYVYDIDCGNGFMNLYLYLIYCVH